LEAHVPQDEGIEHSQEQAGEEERI
jgi:hypothetical protein